MILSTMGFFFTNHGRGNPDRQVAMATEFCTVAPNICVPSEWNLLHVFWILELLEGS
jgi:hypothetical protein